MRLLFLLSVAVLAGCAADVKQLPPTLDPSSEQGAESDDQTLRSLAGPVAREARPLEPPAESASMEGHDMGTNQPAAHDHTGHDETAATKAGQHAAPSKPDANAKPQTIYTCPMHPEVQQAGPGRCPKCGMKLVPEQKPPAPHQHGHHP